MIDSKIIDEINKQTDIVALVSEFVPLQKAGKGYKGLCPFHTEKTPSFSVSPEKKLAKCMSCGEGGNALNFYSKIRHISFPEAVIELGARLGIEIKGYKKEVDIHELKYQIMRETTKFYQMNLYNSEPGKNALEYLKKRGLNGEVIDHFSIGYSPAKKDALFSYLRDKGYSVLDIVELGLAKEGNDQQHFDLFHNRIMIPITDANGNVIAFGGRAIASNDAVKYINSPESVIFSKGENLFHYSYLARTLKKKDTPILYEGYFDVISAYQNGYPMGVASMGTALSNKQCTLLKKLKSEVIVAYDGDNAGLAATAKALDILKKQDIVVSALDLPEGLDPDDFLKKYGGESYGKLVTNRIDPYNFYYKYYKRNKNFKNANDIEKFVSEMKDAFKVADVAVKEVFQKLIYDELGLNVAFSEKRVAPKSSRVEPVHISSRYFDAECQLIIALIRDKKWHNIISDNLEVLALSDIIPSNIMRKLLLFRSDEEYSEYMFTEQLESEEKDYYQKHITTNIHYDSKKFSWSEEAIKELISIIMQDGIRSKNIANIEREIRETDEPFKKISLANEKNILIKKGGRNGN